MKSKIRLLGYAPCPDSLILIKGKEKLSDETDTSCRFTYREKSQ